MDTEYTDTEYMDTTVSATIYEFKPITDIDLYLTDASYRANCERLTRIMMDSNFSLELICTLIKDYQTKYKKMKILMPDMELTVDIYMESMIKY